MVAAIVRGEGRLQPISTAGVAERYPYRDDSPPVDAFTDREVEILRLIAGGYSNKEIARSIHLAEGTVKNYVSDILDKLNSIRLRRAAPLRGPAVRKMLNARFGRQSSPGRSNTLARPSRCRSFRDGFEHRQGLERGQAHYRFFSWVMSIDHFT